MIRNDDQTIEDEEQEDRMSNLPRHLTDNILECMLICDAARTSILSKTWKNIWETNPRILVEKQFIKQLISSMKDIQAAKPQYLKVVNSILLSHVGPILKFSLYIPAKLRLYHTPYPCLWIKQLPEKGVKVLDLHNASPNPGIKMPSYIFSCLDLTSLYLHNWKLNPPHKFRGFRNLTRITLRFVVFTTNMSFGTQVQHFELFSCVGIQYLDIQFTNHGKNIKYLSIGRSETMEKRCALDYNPYSDIKKSFNLRRLLGNMPSIETLQLDGTSLAYLDPGLTFHNHLTSTMENLKKLTLYKVALDNVYVISNALCLLRSMPILEHLMIEVGPDVNSCGRHMKLSAEQHLESPDCADITLNQLQKVTMRKTLGSRAELLLIKRLLASSPSLRSMNLRPNTEGDYDFRELLQQFSRKSPVGRIFWGGVELSS